MKAWKDISTLLKAGTEGEGTRGGNVIGHTKSGKPIYGHHLDAGHLGFDMNDHKDAANFHMSVVDAAIDKIDQRRKQDPTFALPQKVIEFLNYHRKQAQFHQSKANQKMDIKDRNQKQIAEVMREQAMGITRKDRPLKKSDANYYVAVVPVNPFGQVLIAKRKEDGIWTTPAGGADLGETPEEAAVRECWEEANLKVMPEQLEPMGSKLAPNGKPVHCFLLRCTQFDTSVKCDPDQEVKEWLWRSPREFPKELSSEKNKNRLETINQALLKFHLIRKSEIAMNGEHGNPSIETSDYSIDENAALSSEWLEKIKEAMKDYAYGQEPVEFMLPNSHKMSLVKVDDGLYSGFVKKTDGEGLTDTVLRIEKISIPTIIQFLRAKEVLEGPTKMSSDDVGKMYAAEMNRLGEEIAAQEAASMEEDYVEEVPEGYPEAPQEEQDAHGLAELAAILSQFKGEGNTININFYKGKDNE